MKRIITFLLLLTVLLFGKESVADAQEKRVVESVENFQPVETENMHIIETRKGAGGVAYEVESNDTVETANAVTFGDTIHASISDGDEKGDWYKIVVPSLGKVTLKVHSELEYYTREMWYYNEEKGGWECSYNEENHWNENLKFIENEGEYYVMPGTYYLWIGGVKYSSSSYYYTGNYTIQLNFSSTSITENEPNNAFDVAMNVGSGTTVAGQISLNDWVDMYKVSINSTGKISLAVTSYLYAYDVILYDSSYKEVWRAEYNRVEDDSTYRNDEFLWYLEPGIYYIKFTQDIDDEKAYTGLYNLKFTCESSNTSFEGDDNSAATAKEVGFNQTYTGQLSYGDEYDTYKFTVSQGRKVPLTITSYMESYGAKIYNSNGYTVWSETGNYLSSGATYRKDEHTITLAAGTYYLEISDGSYYTYTGLYKFSFSGGQVTSLKLNKTSKKLKKGSTYQLRAIMSPTDCEVSWKTSNKKVATVSKGKVSAKGYGKAVITCTTKDGSKKKATCTITVVPQKGKFSKVKKVGNKRKILIKSQSGVTGYEVYAKTKRSSWKIYKKIKGAKNKSFTVKNSYFNTHSFKVRAYKKVGKQKYYGDFSKVL